MPCPITPADLAVLRIFRIDVRWVDITGHHCEQHDVALGQRSRQRRAVTDLNFVERPVLEILHVRVEQYAKREGARRLIHLPVINLSHIAL
jgi:hypothetical protein